MLYLADTIAFYDIPVYCYRIGREGQSVSYSSMVRRYNEHEKVLFQLIEIYNAHNGDKKNVAISNRIFNMIALQYGIYLHMNPIKDNKQRLVSFDSKLSREKEFYPTKLKKVKMLRFSHFALYSKIAKFEQRKNNGTTATY